MSQDAKKEINKILDEMRSLGFTVEQTRRGGHWHIIDPDTGTRISCAATPSDAKAPQYVRNDIKKHLGVDLRKPPARKKGTADDWHLGRLRSRTIAQMERGASEADIARMAICANEDKNIGGWTSFNSASVGISSFLKGGRLMKANHDTLAAALGKLESSAEQKVFERHLNDAAERLGQKRLRPHKTVEPEAGPGEASPIRQPDSKDPGGTEAVEVESELSASTPRDLTVTIRIEIDPATRAWLTGMLGEIQVFTD